MLGNMCIPGKEAEIKRAEIKRMKNMFKRRAVAEKNAVESAKRNKPSQAGYQNMPVHRLSIDATPDQFLDYYRRVRGTYLTVSSAIVPVPIRLPSQDDDPFFDSTGAPITTPPVEESKDASFHISELFNPLDPTGPVLQIAVQQFSGYAMAFRVLYPTYDPILHPWYAFFGAEKELPKHLFHTVFTCAYRMQYDDINAIQIYQLILREVFDHFVDFQKTEVEFSLRGDELELTDDGQRFKDTLFFLIGECQRFYVLQILAWQSSAAAEFHAILADIPYSEPMIHRWAYFSEAIEKLWLALWEEEHGLPYEESRDRALIMLEQLTAMFPQLDFMSEGEYDLELLAGSMVQVLNCHLPTVKKLLMRFGGFKEEFPS